MQQWSKKKLFELPGTAHTRSTDESLRCPSHHHPSFPSFAGPVGSKNCLSVYKSESLKEYFTSVVMAKAGRSRVSPTNTFIFKSSVRFLDNYDMSATPSAFYRHFTINLDNLLHGPSSPLMMELSLVLMTFSLLSVPLVRFQYHSITGNNWNK